MTEREGLLPAGYLFSQHSLNTYVRCPRRFLLRYVQRLTWPGQESEALLDEARQLERGRVFHQWLAREQLGLDVGPIVAACDDPVLQRWWAASRSFRRDDLPRGVRQAELPVVVRLGRWRLYARYDLLAADPGGEAVIVDWKTLATRPQPRVLAERMQTRVYLYALISCGEALTDQTIEPQRATMRYWFAEFPDADAVVRYSGAQFARDGEWLEALAGRIAGSTEEAFTPTDDLRQCAACTYRTYCHSEAAAVAAQGQADDGWLDEEVDFALDLDEVPELDY